jgi:hypothetical protein
MRILTPLLLALLLAQSAGAQDKVPVDVSGGYQLQRLGGRLLGTGWYGDVAVPLGQHVSIPIEAASSFDSYEQSIDTYFLRAGIRSSYRMLSGMGGVRVAARPHPRLRVYLQLLGGVTQFRIRVAYSLDGIAGLPPFVDQFGLAPYLSGFSDSRSANFASVRGGGGVMLGLTSRVGMRAHFDYGGFFGDDSPSASQRLNAGMVVRF